MEIVVIGGGPGGYVSAIRAAQLGANVILIEKENLGGTCLNVGCIPTKTLLNAAEIYDKAKKGSKFGIMADVTVDFKKTQKKKKAITKRLVAGVKGLLASNKVNVIEGSASFIDRKTLKVISKDGSENKINFDKLIIATGSSPTTPNIKGIDNPRCIDTTGALELSEVPKTLAVIGGGIIAIEMADIYSTLGSKVTIVSEDNILPEMDKDLTKILCDKFSNSGTKIYDNAEVVCIDEEDSAVVNIKLNTKESEKVYCEKVILSVDRRANTKSLDMDIVGIEHNNGTIKVNNKMETNIPGIYAIGDCNGRMMLAHVASEQGIIAAENAMGENKVFNERTNPICVYTNPEFASVGLTEKEVKAQSIEYLVGNFPLGANGKSLIINGGEGMIKFIIGKEYGEILGVHILGPRATDLIGECALAIGMEATVDEFIDTIHPHPTVSEAIKEASLATLKRAIHIPN